MTAEHTRWNGTKDETYASEQDFVDAHGLELIPKPATYGNVVMFTLENHLGEKKYIVFLRDTSPNHYKWSSKLAPSPAIAYERVKQAMQNPPKFPLT